MTRLLATLAIVFARQLAAADAPKAPTFEADVLPVLNAHCLQCHGGVHQKNGLDLRTLPTVLKGGKSGPVVVPGKPAESLLWQKIEKDVMPKTDNKVSDANKRLIREWIASGAKGAERSRGAAVTRAAKKPAEVAKHIDKEIGFRLRAAKVPPSPRSDDGEFLRRVYLDIVGKPPTAQQAATFLDSADADKRAKLMGVPIDFGSWLD